MVSDLDLKFASAVYIHSPRLVAEILAFVDEIGDFIKEHMSNNTRQVCRNG